MSNSSSMGTGTVEFARLPDKVAVIRIEGRCTFQNSTFLEKAAEICEREHGDEARFVLDLDRCETMDSTFLGVVAGIANRQRKRKHGNLIAVNVSPQIHKTMSTLGLTHVLEVRRQAQAIESAAAEVVVNETTKVDMPKADQVAHMLQAHRTLVEIDSGNEVRFENVIKYLGDTLYRARAGETK